MFRKRKDYIIPIYVKALFKPLKNIIALNRIKDSITIFCFVLGSIYFLSCVEPYELQSINYEDLLVVEGFVSNLDEEYYVKLSRLVPLGSDSVYPVGKATISIVDENEFQFFFTEGDRGNYTMDNNSFNAKTGGVYKLRIQTTDGNIYESEFAEVFESPPIDSIYFEYDQVVNFEGNVSKGIQFFVDVDAEASKAEYFNYEWEETWIIDPPYTHPLKPIGSDPCYKTVKSEGNLKLATTKDFQQQVVLKHPINFVDNRTNRLTYHYSMLVKQYALSKEAYEYYNKIREQNYNTGSVFDKTPSSITGNIKCITNPDLLVVGFFQVYGGSDKRIFVKREELLDELFKSIPTGYKYCAKSLCYPVEDNVLRYSYVKCSSDSLNNPIYINSDEQYRPMPETLMLLQDILYQSCDVGNECSLPGQVNIIAVYEEYCWDCRLSGGELAPPSFWPNN